MRITVKTTIQNKMGLQWEIELRDNFYIANDGDVRRFIHQLRDRIVESGLAEFNEKGPDSRTDTQGN